MCRYNEVFFFFKLRFKVKSFHDFFIIKILKNDSEEDEIKREEEVLLL